VKHVDVQDDNKLKQIYVPLTEFQQRVTNGEFAEVYQVEFKTEQQPDIECRGSIET